MTTRWAGMSTRKDGISLEPEKYDIKQNENKIWTSFAKSALNLRTRIASISCLCASGACNNIFLMEGWGFIQEAAKREWIAIVPSLELDDIIEEILEEAKELYPIDESRVYATGFSYGGWASNRLGNQRPDIFAAVGPCGASIDNAFAEGSSDDREPIPPFDGIPRALELGTYMPLLTYMQALMASDSQSMTFRVGSSGFHIWRHPLI